MRHARTILSTVLSVVLLGCASEGTKPDASSNEPITISARGYTADGCVFNLSREAREQKLRLNLNEVEVNTSLFFLIFPILDQEGYRCSGPALTAPRRQFMDGDVSLYPVY